MKRIIFTALALLLPFAGWSQKARDYTFTTIKANPVTTPKDQDETGTCWCHAATAMIESEIIRINNITDPNKYPDLSEWFTVYNAYMDRSVKYVRLNGHMTSGPGSLSPDMIHIVKDYGIVPESAMPCLTKKPNHRQMDKDLRACFNGIVDDKSQLRTDAWRDGVRNILEETLGKCPKTFVVDGVTYTPESYRDALGIDSDNYVTLTSFTHFPFYEAAAIDVPDNWRWDRAYNLPLEEFMKVVYHAINAGYTMAWGMDGTEPGYTSEGLCVLPSDAAPVTQESRQSDYEMQLTIDDHLMQVYGYAVDQNGKPFFMIKDSHGEYGAYKGHRYASEEFFKDKTMYITLNKAAIPAAIRKKIGL